MYLWIMEMITAAPTPTPSPSTSHSGSSTSAWVPLATLAAAIIAATVAGLAAYLQRKSGREAAKAADRAAQAAEKSVEVNDRTSLGVAQRAEADALAKRYQDAAVQLGHEKAAVRLAGVYAMARLADDWPQERQTCVDVLCAYMRMPELRDVPERASYHGDLQVRSTILQLIANHTDQSIPHMGKGAPKSWSECKFDLSGAIIRDLDWRHLTFDQPVSFVDATFEGDCSVENCNFDWAGASFNRAIVKGNLRIRTIHAVECGITFVDARVDVGGKMQVDVGSLGAVAKWNLQGLNLNGEIRIGISPDAHQDTLEMPMVTVNRGGKALITCWGSNLDKEDAKEYGVPFLDFTHWNVATDGEVQIDRRLFDIWAARWEPGEIAPKARVILNVGPLTP